MTRTFYTLGFALVLAMCAAPLSDALARPTVTIDTNAGGNVYGNGDGPNGTNPGGDTDTLLDPNNNTVIINGGTVTDNVYGGHVYNANADSAAATGNSVTINSGTVNGSDVYGGYAQSDGGSVTATGNSATINGGMVDAFVSGGYSRSSDSATATGNSVTINGGEVAESVFGGNAYSGTTGNVVAVGNAVTVNGGTVRQNVIGGRASTDSGTATATGNSVTVNGGEIGGYVAGGRANVSGNGTNRITATNNTVTISGGPLLSATTSLYGGTINGALATIAPELFTGNTLNVWNYTGTAVADVHNFEFYNFVLPASLKGLEVTGKATLNDGQNGSKGSSVPGVSVVGGAAPVQPGTSVTLIDARGASLAANGFTQTKAQGKHGATLLYDWTLARSSTALTATLNSVQLNPQTKALAEGWLGGLALTTQGADLVAGQGMGNAVSATYGAGGSGFGAFAALSGGWSRYNTGSHVDMSSISLMTGLTWGVDATPGHLTLGAFFEYGTGSYDTHNSFSNAASVDGDGDAYYLGGGVLGRMDFANTGPGRFYTEASVRIGSLHNEYNGGDLRDGMGRSADYDPSSLYYGLHAGLGYIWNITDKDSLDVYGKYFWTRQQGDSVTLSTNDPVTFKDADSHRLRGGARFSYAINEYVSPYVGAAWEHEFDGNARASTYGYSIDAPSLKGDTSIGEIGLTLIPSKNCPLSFDLGVQGYTGKREGVTGSFRLKWEY